MDEFKFVIKCFIFASLLLTLSQLKTNGLTIESRIESSLVNTTVAKVLNETAQGGALFAQKFYHASKKTVLGWMGVETSNTSAFEFKTTAVKNRNTRESASTQTPVQSVNNQISPNEEADFESESF